MSNAGKMSAVGKMLHDVLRGLRPGSSAVTLQLRDCDELVDRLLVDQLRQPDRAELRCRPRRPCSR